MFLVTFPAFLYFLNEDHYWYKSDIQKNYVNKHSNRTFFHSRAQMELTRVEPTIDQKSCNYMKPIAVFIHSSAQISGKYFTKRQILRKTWVTEVKRNNISVYFVIGMNGTQSVDQRLKEEAEEYKDIVQFSFIDNYYNITLKAISILRWIDRKCPKTKYILKTDDDVLVNINLLVDKLDSFETGFSGQLLRYVGPQRVETDKWFIPPKYYPQTYFPNYMNGPAYVMAGPIVKQLVKTIDNYFGYVLDIDDLFISGIIAEKSGVERYESSYIKPYGCADVCVLHSSAVTFGCKSQEMLSLWTEWKNTSQVFCKNVYLKTFCLISFTVLMILTTISLFIYIYCCYGFDRSYLSLKPFPYKRIIL